MTPEQRAIGAAELARIETGQRRAISWLKKNVDRRAKPPAHITKALNEVRALEEMTAAIRDKEAQDEYERLRDPTKPPPIPTAGKVALTKGAAIPLMLAMLVKHEREKHDQEAARAKAALEPNAGAGVQDQVGAVSGTPGEGAGGVAGDGEPVREDAQAEHPASAGAGGA